MKRTAKIILSMTLLTSGAASADAGLAARETGAAFSVMSAMGTALPTILLMELPGTTASTGSMDRKILVERIANDALLNLETNQKTALLEAVFEDLREKYVELKKVDDRTISKRLIQEAIHLNISGN